VAVVVVVALLAALAGPVVGQRAQAGRARLLIQAPETPEAVVVACTAALVLRLGQAALES
jgi:hypothetical protein